jgi:fructokinase
MANAQALFGGIEAGGTKFVLGLGRGPDDIQSRFTIPTTSPAETLKAVVDWFASQPQIAALGIASFGPVDLNIASPTWGYITNTTKAGWSNTDIAQALRSTLGIPVGFDTDVNGAALGEALWGAAQGCQSSVYITVGTGIGGGAIIDGRPVHGLGHPEMGHIFPSRHAGDLEFSGVCPFHGSCCEGLASGPAILARYGTPLSELPADHSGHDVIASYLAQLMHSVQSILAPERIILGGGVMKTPGLLDRIRLASGSLGGGYFLGQADRIIVSPGLGENSGLVGAFALAQRAMEANQ